MAARQEVHKIGTELICRYNSIHMRLTDFLQRTEGLQEIVKDRCKARAAAITGRKKSGVQCVFEIIQSSAAGVDPFLIKRVTGFREQKIAKILYKLFKYGEIRIEPGGRYLAAAGR